MALASEYGQKLYTGVFYRNPDPPPTFEAEARKRQQEARAQARPKDRILEMFRPGGP
jgi:2-oxoglutarate ferredoxin oxidoreductase subunit beta